MEVPVVTLLVTPGTGRDAGARRSAGADPARAAEHAGHRPGDDPGTRVSALMGTLTGGAQRPAGAGLARGGRCPSPPTTVEVYRGGQRTLERFEQLISPILQPAEAFELSSRRLAPAMPWSSLAFAPSPCCSA